MAVTGDSCFIKRLISCLTMCRLHQASSHWPSVICILSSFPCVCVCVFKLPVEPDSFNILGLQNYPVVIRAAIFLLQLASRSLQFNASASFSPHRISCSLRLPTRSQPGYPCWHATFLQEQGLKAILISSKYLHRTSFYFLKLVKYQERYPNDTTVHEQ